MKHRLALCALLWAALLAGQSAMKMSVRQLVQFVRSSIELKHDDKKVAAYVRKIVMTEQLSPSVIEDLLGKGAGPHTYEALQALVEASKALPAAAREVPKPPPPTIPPPSLEDQKRIIEETRQYALNYTKSLPNFICTQVTRRYADPSGLEFFAQQDTITTKLSFFEQKEDYKVVLVNSRPTDVSYENIGGSISAGEFGTMLREIFEPSSDATFKWSRWTTLRGRRTHVYEYQVPQPRSKWRITYEKTLEIIAGYKGLVYVDANDGAVARIRLEAVDMPASFPVQQASVELDYDLIPIADQTFMLPLRHTMRMRSGKLLVKNDVEFRMYRRFGADTTITFDTPDALPDDKFAEKPIK